MKIVTISLLCTGILLSTVDVSAFDLVKNSKTAEIVLAEIPVKQGIKKSPNVLKKLF